MAFLEEGGGSSEDTCAVTRSSKTEGWRVRRRAAGSIGKRVSSRARRSNRTFLFFFGGRSSFPTASSASGSPKDRKGEGSPRGYRRQREKRAGTSVRVRPRHPVLCVCFPTRAPGGRPSDPPSRHPLSPPVRRGAWARRGSWHRPPRRSCVCRPASRPTRDCLARLLGSVRQVSRAREWRDRERCLRVFENFLFGCQGQSCGFMPAPWLPSSISHNRNTLERKSTQLAIACSRLSLRRRGASARSDASTASSSPWLPSPCPPPWPPPPFCSPARRAIPRFPEL